MIVLASKYSIVLHHDGSHDLPEITKTKTCTSSLTEVLRYQHLTKYKVWCSLEISSLLEIQHLDSKWIDNGKEQRKSNNCNSNWSQEVMFVSEIPVQEMLHSFTCVHGWIIYVSKLWGKQAVKGPRNWACPEVPPPPYRYPLWSINEL